MVKVVETEALPEEKLRGRMLAQGIAPRFAGARRADIPEKVVRLLNVRASLFVHGPVGTGKTHILAAIMRAYLETRPLQTFSDGVTTSRPWPRFISVPNLLLEVRKVFGGQAVKTDAELIADYGTAEILMLDDMGVEKPTEWALQTLYSIIDRRYGEMRQTFITSNFSLGELSARVGDRITSRIAGMCEVIPIKGDDRRTKRKEVSCSD